MNDWHACKGLLEVKGESANDWHPTEESNASTDEGEGRPTDGGGEGV